MRKSISILFISFLVLFSNCRKLEPEENELQTDIDIPDWSEETHGSNTSPDYGVVFPQNEVIQIDIKISADDWATMQVDLAENISSNQGGPGGPPGGNAGSFGDYVPVWVPSSVFYNGTEWYKVGIRYKGNSSLRSTYQAGINKLSFKLDFDQFEDAYPDITDQRFYGFKQLNLKNNFEDASLVREKIATDLFIEFGLASPQTTFCELYVDFGSGPQYFGIYTLVEEVDDTVIDNFFKSNNGNLYKPDGAAASFAWGTYNDIEMEKKNNEDSADYSDVFALYTSINSETKDTDIEGWKTNLESILNVEVFLKWLAANTVMQNWDTYGRMTHNYYLYNNPENNLITWIPWDNNEALMEGKQGGALSLELSEVGNNWPLIRYIIDNEEYLSQFNENISAFITDAFTIEKMHALYDSYYLLLKDYAYAEQPSYTFINNDSDFDNAFQQLKTHVGERNSEVSNYLN